MIVGRMDSVTEQIVRSSNPCVCRPVTNMHGGVDKVAASRVIPVLGDILLARIVRAAALLSRTTRVAVAMRP